MKKKLLRGTAILLTMVLISSCVTFALDTAETSVPSDVAGAVYEQAVKTLFEEGIITGDTDGLFHPDSTLTRAQACIIVVKSMNPPAAEVTGTATQQVGKSGFSDMSGYGWAEGYISYAVKHGITKGYPDGTFKPGNKVTMNELITMTVRASGYSDEQIGGTWPANYTSKAAELELFGNIPSPMPAFATKWMAAQMDYNAMSLINAATADSRQQADHELDAVPNVKAMVFTNGSFDATTKKFDGIDISNQIIIYTYGEKQKYSSTMTFSNRISDYRLDTVYKYKNAKTPAYYKLENNKITMMVLPMDVGFSGRAYSVINNTISTMNGGGDKITGLETLTATRDITWLGKEGLAGVPTSAQYLLGELYELNLSGGEIQSIYKSSDAGKVGDIFEEISSTGAIFVDVESFDNGVVKVTAADGGAIFSVKSNASVYILDQSDPTEYKAGRTSNIRTGVQIRAYDISDDDETSADIVVVLR